MLEVLTNILLGPLFEITFISVMFYKIKNIKLNKVLLFITTFIIYYLSGFLTQYDYHNQYLFYLIFNVLLFLCFKLIYKRKIILIDMFVIYYIGVILTFSCLIMMKIIGYNLLFMYLNRMILLIILLISSKLNRLYKIYCYNWNRHKDNKIKAITLRNTTIISCNLMLYIINYFVLNYLIKVVS